MAEAIEVVRATRLEIVDADGIVRVVVGEVHSANGVFGVSVRDAGGAERACIVTDDDGTVYAGVAAGGNEIVGASVSTTGRALVFISQRDGTVVRFAHNDES